MEIQKIRKQEKCQEPMQPSKSPATCCVCGWQKLFCMEKVLKIRSKTPNFWSINECLWILLLFVLFVDYTNIHEKDLNNSHDFYRPGKKKNPNISRFSQATHVKKRVWCGRLYSTVVNYVIIRLSGQWKPFCSRLADPQANHFGGMGVTEREQGKRQQQFHMPLFLSPPESVQFELSCTHHLEHSVKKY